MKWLLPPLAGLSLGKRFFLGVFLILAIVSCGFYITIAKSFELLDDQLVNRNLHERMHLFIDSYAQYGDATLMPKAANFIGFIGAHPNSPPVPAVIKDIPAGEVTNDLQINRRYYHALREVYQGRDFYLMLDDGFLEAIKTRIGLIAITSLTLAIIVSLLIAGWLSRLISRPVTALALAVNDYLPEAYPANKLGDRFRDDEVASIARAFDSFVERLTRFVDREQAFTEDASHELRTPLTVILSSLQLLAEDKTVSISGQARLARIQRAAENMQSLIDALLWISREDSPATMPSVELGELSRDLVQQLSEQIQRKPVTLEFQNLSNYPRFVPKGMAGSIVSNLLINALNHTEQGAIELIVHDDRLIVRDNGYGINMDDIPHIFERRYRGGRSRGQGLGLYIVKRICQSLNWRISVSSAPGKGACFIIELPPADNV